MIFQENNEVFYKKSDILVLASFMSFNKDLFYL